MRFRGQKTSLPHTLVAVIVMHLFLSQVVRKQAAEYAKSVHALFAETSAKTAVNVYEFFMDISRFFSVLSDTVLITYFAFIKQPNLFHQRPQPFVHAQHPQQLQVKKLLFWRNMTRMK